MLPLSIFPKGHHDIIKSKKVYGEARACTGKKIPYYLVEIQDFEIAEGLIIPSIEVGVIDAEIDHSLLGFDILSLFSLKYDASLNNGLWYIIGSGTTDDIITSILNRRFNRDDNKIRQHGVAAIPHYEYFDSEKYLRNYYGDKFQYLPIAAVEHCKTKEDCVALIEQLKDIIQPWCLYFTYTTLSDIFHIM